MCFYKLAVRVLSQNLREWILSLLLILIKPSPARFYYTIKDSESRQLSWGRDTNTRPRLLGCNK